MNRNAIYRIFSRIPVLRTPRLVLRRMVPEDARDMYEYARRRDVTEYLTWYPHRDVRYTHDYLEYLEGRYAAGDFFDWAVTLRESGKMIGTCGYTSFDFEHDSGETGYVLNPEYRGHELIPEALHAVMKFGFEELLLNRIEAHYIVGNEASRRVMEKVGMRYEGISRGAMLIKGSYRDIGTCAVLREDFLREI